MTIAAVVSLIGFPLAFWIDRKGGRGRWHTVGLNLFDGFWISAAFLGAFSYLNALWGLVI